MAEQIIHLPDLGAITLIESERVFSLSIIIEPFQGVRVIHPSWMGVQKVVLAIREKAEWIHKQKAKVARVEKRYTAFTDGRSYSTRAHTLQLEKHARPTLRILVSNGVIRVWYPENVNADHPKVQAAIRKGIEEAWRMEGRSWLPRRTEELAKKCNFSYQKITVRNSKTRWGSCSWDNNISLSLHLMMLPDHLIDYVILHELAHTVHKNHGKEFWKLLDQITGNVKALEDEINDYHIGIY